LHQGEHKLLHLLTNKIITRRDITSLLITKSILDQVSNIAINKGMPIGLKIKSKTDSLLYNLAWIAGVDYQDNDQNTGNNNENNQDNKENQDKMHPDDIAGLAQENQQETNHQVDNQN
jgi:hypothetical protein